MPIQQTFKELTWKAIWHLIDNKVKDVVADKVVDEEENKANGGNKMRREQKCTIYKG